MIEYFLGTLAVIILFGIMGFSLVSCLFGIMDQCSFHDNSLKKNAILILGGLLGLTLTCGLFVAGLSTDAATHGSCKYEHWMGKAYVCDEYYPLPIKETPNG